MLYTYKSLEETLFKLTCNQIKEREAKFSMYVGGECNQHPGFFEMLSPVCHISGSGMRPMVWGEDPRIVVMRHEEMTWYAEWHSKINSETRSFFQVSRGLCPREACIELLRKF